MVGHRALFTSCLLLGCGSPKPEPVLEVFILYDHGDPCSDKYCQPRARANLCFPDSADTNELPLTRLEYLFLGEDQAYLVWYVMCADASRGGADVEVRAVQHRQNPGGGWTVWYDDFTITCEPSSDDLGIMECTTNWPLDWVRTRARRVATFPSPGTRLSSPRCGTYTGSEGNSYTYGVGFQGGPDEPILSVSIYAPNNIGNAQYQYVPQIAVEDACETGSCPWNFLDPFWMEPEGGDTVWIYRCSERPVSFPEL